MLGLLLARAGRRVLLLEKHADFLHDFRGDTIHPATLRLMQDLGWLDEFLRLPHQRAEALYAEIDGKQLAIADFRTLPLPEACRHIAFMPQWDFLAFLTGKAEHYPGFELRMGTEVTGLLREGERVIGLTARGAAGDETQLFAPLVVGADGRHSRIRALAGLQVQDFGSAVDVLWFQLPRAPEDPAPAMSHAGPQQGLVMVDRGSYWQCGYVIGKDRFDEVKAAGLPAFRAALAALAPLPAQRFETLEDWNQVHLLSVRLDRLDKWWAPGVLCIGDAAHAMSPVGGFGVNLAIQDAVAAARILREPLRRGDLRDADLAAVQKRRDFPTKATQKLQMMMRRKRKPDGKPRRKGPPKFLKVLARFPVLSRLMGRLIGLGFRSERIE